MLRLGGAKPRSLLAILLLRAGEVVSADTLVGALWGDDPPADRATALHQHISRLRRALEPHDVVLTRAPGYLIELDAGDIDVRTFEQLCAEGRESLAADDPASAAAVLRTALALWRGRPLGDLELEPFATEAVAQLDEGHAEAFELRVEADLALGRHAELVPELTGLIRRHPLRERLRGQIMVALYRSGRQGDALEAYADTRRTLSAELGLEPGPTLQTLQRQILDQDPALDPVPAEPAPAPQAGTSHVPRPRRWIAAGLVLVAALAGVILATRDDGGDQRPAPAAAGDGGRLVVIDAASGRVTSTIRAGRTPASLAGGAGGRVWVVDADARTVLAVDPVSGEVATLATGATPTDVAVGGGSVWVTNGRPAGSAQFVGPVATEVVQLDADARTQRATVALPPREGPVANQVENQIAATDEAVWALNPSGTVARISTRTAEVTATSTSLAAIAVGAGGAGVWALRVDGVVVALDPETAKAVSRVRLPTGAPTALAVSDAGAWVTSSADGTLWRIGRGGEVGSVEVGSGVTDVAADGRSAWVANPVAGTITQVDAATMTVSRTVRVEGLPRALAIEGGSVLATVAGTEAASSSQVSGLDELPAGTCAPAIAGPDGDADLLVTSDLPLQGGVRVSANQMVQAIRFVLRERDFRAGEFRLAYQSCDDSVARTGLFDEAKCAANARAYGRNEDVVAVIGTMNSPCAVAAVPELNRAPGGPLAMISPLNSFVGLTRDAVGVPPTLLSELYPTGRRNYLRVFPTDDLQGAALALIARDRGQDTVYVLDDGEPGYGRLLADGYETAAERLGLRVAGRSRWNPGARSYTGLARKVAASGAQAVFLGGLLDTNAGQVIRDLRAELGPGVDLTGPDGLAPLALLRRAAGPAADDMLVSLPGVLSDGLPEEGAAFVRRFAGTQPGAEIEPSAVYAAQATEVLLDAIARSDGSRSSIIDALFATRVEGGLLGDFVFDERGDISESPVTILRVDPRPAPAGEAGGRRAEGGAIERVARPSADLVATRPAP